MNRRWAIILGIGVIGAIAGWLYWKYVGCASGSCGITSDPLNSTLYGGVMGGLLGDLLNGRRAKDGQRTTTN